MATTRIDRIFRNRAGTALYAVLRRSSSDGASGEYQVVEWCPDTGVVLIAAYAVDAARQASIIARDEAIATARNAASS